MVAPIFILFLLPLFATFATGPILLEAPILEYVKTVAGAVKRELLDSGGGGLADKAISLVRETGEPAARLQGGSRGLVILTLISLIVVSFSFLHCSMLLTHIMSGSYHYGLCVHRTGTERWKERLQGHLGKDGGAWTTARHPQDL